MKNTEYQQKHIKLIKTLKNKGISNQNLLDAIGKIPRHLFINPELASVEQAYEDIPLSIGQEQTISQPYTVAYQTSLLEINENDKVLEIGTGSGYQSAVLSELGASVFTIERQKKLFEATRHLLTNLGYDNIQMFYGDGYQGIEEFAPFDKIIVTAASPGIPEKLIEQLKIGGVMVIPVDGKVQKMCRVIKTSATESKIQEFDDFKFVPLLPGKTG